MKTTIRYIIMNLLVWLATVCTAAQTFDNIAMGDAPTVCALAQDEQGVVWLGTERGLYSYDGYRTIAHNANADGTPVTTRIHSMCMYRGTIYLGTERGLAIYDIRRGRYADMPDNRISDVRAVCVQGGRLWIGGAQGLYCRTLGGEGMVKAENRRVHNIYSMLPTRRGLLIGTIDGLYLRHADGTMRRIPIDGGRQPLVNALLADKSPKASTTAEPGVWVGTEGALYRYDWHTMHSVAALESNSVKSLAMQADRLYAGTDNGMYIYNKVTAATSHALHDSRSTRSIANNIVWAVMADRWGNVWAGTDQGVSAIYRQPFFDYTPLGDIVRTGDGNCLHLMARGADNMMWLGGTNGLIGYRATHGFLPDNVGSVTWFRQNSTTHYMSHNRVRRVYTDDDGTTLVCTDHGLNIYNPTTRQMRNVIVVDPTHRYTTAWAYDVVADREGRYWISSYMGGVFVIGKRRLLAATTPTIVADRHFLHELQGTHVWQLARDGRGRIWARMYDRGLDRIDPATMQVEHIVGKQRPVDDLCADSKGNVWVAMDGEIRRFGMNAKDDLSLSIAGYEGNAAAQLCEVEGDIWALVGHDCCILSPSGTSTRFAVPGFQPLAIAYDSMSRRVLLGGNDGMVSIPTANVGRSHIGNGIRRGIDAPSARPFFLLTGLMIDGQQFVPDDGNPTYICELTLAAHQNNVTFQFSDLPMAGRQPHVYAYRLDGADRTWLYLHGRRDDISYSALPPGHYTLEVREVDGRGEAKALVYSLPVTILPPWYLSVWARLLYMAIAIALVIWAMKFYIMRRRLREERRAKERVMQESAARSQFFDNMSMQLRRPLGSMFVSTQSMLRGEKVATRVQQLEQMRRSVADMNTLVYRAFDMQRTASEAVVVGGERVPVDIVDLCRHAIDDARHRHGKVADILFHTDASGAYAEVDVVRLQPAVDMLIDFALCNSCPSGHATIDVATADDMVSVSVGMEGLKITDEEMPLVFNRYFALDKVGGTPSNTLALVDEVVRQNGGVARVTVDDTRTSLVLTFGMMHKANNENAVAAATAARPVPTAMPADDSADARLLAQATAAVEQHIADSDFNVTRLQETLGIGSKLLYRKLKQMTGKTPVEFIRYIRMQRAAVLLREGRFAVSEVMYMVGFSNSSYFSKVFQKAYGMTPAEYASK